MPESDYQKEQEWRQTFWRFVKETGEYYEAKTSNVWLLLAIWLVGSVAVWVGVELAAWAKIAGCILVFLFLSAAAAWNTASKKAIAAEANLAALQSGHERTLSKAQALLELRGLYQDGKILFREWTQEKDLTNSWLEWQIKYRDLCFKYMNPEWAESLQRIDQRGFQVAFIKMNQKHAWQNNTVEQAMGELWSILENLREPLETGHIYHAFE